MISFSKIFNKILKRSTQSLHKLSNFTRESLLSESNKENCLKCWTKTTHQITSSNTRTSNSRKKIKSAGTNIDTKINYDRKVFESNSKYSASAAVLIPLCVDNKEEISLLYTRRSGKVSKHAKQISFPGGMKDKTDVSYEDCALRETEEEIGLNRNRVCIWGAGNIIEIPERPPIIPVIGIIEEFSLKELKLNKNEVEEAFTVPIEVLCSTNTMRYTQFRSGYSIPVFLIDTNRNRRIWGITAVITRMFLNCFLPKGLYNHKVEYNVRPFKIT